MILGECHFVWEQIYIEVIPLVLTSAVLCQRSKVIVLNKLADSPHCLNWWKIKSCGPEIKAPLISNEIESTWFVEFRADTTLVCRATNASIVPSH